MEAEPGSMAAGWSQVSGFPVPPHSHFQSHSQLLRYRYHVLPEYVPRRARAAVVESVVRVGNPRGSRHDASTYRPRPAHRHPGRRKRSPSLTRGSKTADTRTVGVLGRCSCMVRPAARVVLVWPVAAQPGAGGFEHGRGPGHGHRGKCQRQRSCQARVCQREWQPWKRRVTISRSDWDSGSGYLRGEDRFEVRRREARDCQSRGGSVRGRVRVRVAGAEQPNTTIAGSRRGARRL